MLKNERIIAKALLEWTRESQTTFLEAATDEDELKSIAEKRGLSLPSPDFAIFKTVYAEVNKANRNGVRLPEKAVKAGLASLVGKQINFDHNGAGDICGWILDGKLEGKLIVIYGAFFKSMFREELEEVKSLFAAKKLFVSFEIHKYKSDGELALKALADGTYEMEEIHFSGCGLLLTEQPACPKAAVKMLLASRVLSSSEEDRRVSKDIVYAGLEILEESKERGDTGMPDKEDNQEQVVASETQEVIEEVTIETAEVVENVVVAEADSVEEAKTTQTVTESSEVTRTVDTDESGTATETIEVVADRVTETEYSDGVRETVREEVSNKVTFTYEDMLAKEQALAEVTSELATVKAELEELKANKGFSKEDLEAAVQEAKKFSEKVTARRISLGDSGMELSESDLSNDDKYENMLLKAELEELKSSKEVVRNKASLIVASKGDTTDKPKFVKSAVRTVIDKVAWKRD
jgi:hypothetical protein